MSSSLLHCLLLLSVTFTLLFIIYFATMTALPGILSSVHHDHEQSKHHLLIVNVTLSNLTSSKILEQRKKQKKNNILQQQLNSDKDDELLTADQPLDADGNFRLNKKTSSFLNLVHANAKPGSLHDRFLPFERVLSSKRREIREAGRNWPDENPVDQTYVRSRQIPKEIQDIQKKIPAFERDAAKANVMFTQNNMQIAAMIAARQFRLRESVQRRLENMFGKERVPGPDKLADYVRTMHQRQNGGVQAPPPVVQKLDKETAQKIAKRVKKNVLVDTTEHASASPPPLNGNLANLAFGNNNEAAGAPPKSGVVHDFMHDLATQNRQKRIQEWEQHQREIELKKKGIKLSSNGAVAGAQIELLHGNPVPPVKR